MYGPSMALLERLLGGDENPEPEPLTDLERRKLEHEERKVKRRVKRLKKAQDRMACSTCAKAPIREDRLAVSKELKAQRARLEEIRHRLQAS